MIKILKTLRKEKGLCLIVTEIDDKAAGITTEDQRAVIDYLLEAHLIELSDRVDNDTVIKRLKDFLIESVFTHYVDMVGILNYIYTMRNIIKVGRKHPSHSKFLFTTEFKSYVGDESDSNDDNEKEKDFYFGISFKTNMLKKNNLNELEGVLLRAFNILYTNSMNILTMKPKKVNLFLGEKGTEELLCMNVSFCKPNK